MAQDKPLVDLLEDYLGVAASPQPPTPLDYKSLTPNDQVCLIKPFSLMKLNSLRKLTIINFLKDNNYYNPQRVPIYLKCYAAQDMLTLLEKGTPAEKPVKKHKLNETVNLDEWDDLESDSLVMPDLPLDDVQVVEDAEVLHGAGATNNQPCFCYGHCYCNKNSNSDNTNSKEKKKDDYLMGGLQTCNAIYIEYDNDFYDGEWDMPPMCTCKARLEPLTRHVYLPHSSMSLLNEMIYKSVSEILNYLSMFGEAHSAGTGCKVRLLMQLRDLMENEAKALPTFVPASASQFAPPPNAATAPNPTPVVVKKTPKKRYSLLHSAKPPAALHYPKPKKLKFSSTSTSAMKMPKFGYPHHGNPSFPPHGPSFGYPHPGGHNYPVTTYNFNSANIAINVPAMARHSSTRTKAAATPIPKPTPEQQKFQQQTMENANRMAKDMGNMMSNLQWGILGNPQAMDPMESAPDLPPAAPTSSSASATATSASATATSSDPLGKSECVICISHKREMAFGPCGHTVCCHRCSEKLKACPICRISIKSKLKLFIP